MSLVLVDVTVTRNRRLTETFKVIANVNPPFGMQFCQNASLYTLWAAIRSLGYLVEDWTPVASLRINFYLLASLGYLELAQLVAETGVIGLSLAHP